MYSIIMLLTLFLLVTVAALGIIYAPSGSPDDDLLKATKNHDCNGIKKIAEEHVTDEYYGYAMNALKLEGCA
jgi:hypothetical protein